MAKEFPSHKELFQKLATLDGGDYGKYPGYDSMYDGLGTRATKDEAEPLPAMRPATGGPGPNGSLGCVVPSTKSTKIGTTV